MDMTEKPVIASHSNSRSVWGESRNLTDDMFKAICQSCGVAGFNMCAEFIGENPDLDTACDHVLHFLELDPEGTHIALGGDLDGIRNMPAGFTGVQDYPLFADRLQQRGVDEKILMNIFWNNALGVMDRCSI
jgi:membrane dipeptidase